MRVALSPQPGRTDRIPRKRLRVTGGTSDSFRWKACSRVEPGRPPVRRREGMDRNRWPGSMRDCYERTPPGASVPPIFHNERSLPETDLVGGKRWRGTCGRPRSLDPIPTLSRNRRSPHRLDPFLEERFRGYCRRASSTKDCQDLFPVPFENVRSLRPALLDQKERGQPEYALP